MSILPTLEAPTFLVTLPISQKVIKFRPYFVKEKKLLMMAVESKDNKSLVEAVRQLFEVCVISGDISDLCIVDSEYLFYNIRARSESETVDLRYNCEAEFEEKKCKNVLQVELNLLTDLEVSPGLDSIITTSDGRGIKLKHERFDVNSVGEEKLYTPDEIFSMVADNVDYIFDENSTYKVTDIPKKDLIEWLERLKPAEFAKIEDFFTYPPSIRKVFEVKCNKCGTEHSIVVEDIFSFLD